MTSQRLTIPLFIILQLFVVLGCISVQRVLELIVPVPTPVTAIRADTIIASTGYTVQIERRVGWLDVIFIVPDESSDEQDAEIFRFILKRIEVEKLDARITFCVLTGVGMSSPCDIGYLRYKQTE